MQSSESGPPANHPQVEADQSWKPQNSQPWIHPRRGQMLLQMHQQLAAEWSEQMRAYLRKGEQFTFCGYGFERCGQCPELKSENACTIVFSFDRRPLIGVMGCSEELARYLVDHQLGKRRGRQQFEQSAAEQTDGEQQRRTPFTRLEHVLVKKSLTLLLNKLSTIYAAAGLGLARALGQGERVRASLGLLPDDPLIVFRYQVGEADSPFNLFIASGAALVEAVPEAPRPSEPGADSRPLAATTAQLDVKLVLGSWDVTLEELSGLRVGDEIILPNGTDAWLAAGSIPVKRVCVNLSEDRITVALKGGSRGAP